MTYRIPVLWQEHGVIEVEAESLDAAVEQAHGASLPPGSYVDDSFEVDYDGIPFQNPDLDEPIPQP